MRRRRRRSRRARAVLELAVGVERRPATRRRPRDARMAPDILRTVKAAAAEGYPEPRGQCGRGSPPPTGAASARRADQECERRERPARRGRIAVISPRNQPGCRIFVPGTDSAPLHGRRGSSRHHRTELRRHAPPRHTPSRAKRGGGRPERGPGGAPQYARVALPPPYSHHHGNILFHLSLTARNDKNGRKMNLPEPS